MENIKNEVFVGRLGRPPELKYTPNRRPVCELSVAIGGGDGSGGSEETIWKKVIVWGSQAEKCPLFLKKGYKVFIEGVEEVKEYTNKLGERKSYKQIIANLVGFPSL